VAHRRAGAGDQCQCVRLRFRRFRRRVGIAGASRRPSHSAGANGRYGIGRTATPAEIAGWNIDIDRNGGNLPPGRGSVAHGREVFDQQCAACHGAKGEGGVGDRLVGGQGTIATPSRSGPSAAIGPTPPTLFDYIRRAMPQNAPQSLEQ
jgi:mono/diheme cytochrome c family protein